MTAVTKAQDSTTNKPAPASFQWDDAFLLEEQLTEDERLIRDTARARSSFCRA